MKRTQAKPLIVEKEKFDAVLTQLLKMKPIPMKKLKTSGRKGSKAGGRPSIRLDLPGGPSLRFCFMQGGGCLWLGSSRFQGRGGRFRRRAEASGAVARQFPTLSERI